MSYSQEFKGGIGFTNEVHKSEAKSKAYSALYGPPPNNFKAKEEAPPTPQAAFEKKEGSATQVSSKKTELSNLRSKVKEYHKHLLASTPPRLSKMVEQQLTSNYSQLVVTEANLMTSVSGARTIYITSCFPREGKTVASISMAYALGILSNRAVLLVDANFRSPEIGSFFNIKSPLCMVDLVQDRALLVPGILPTYYNNLYILPCSKKPEVSESLDKGKIKSFIRDISESFEYVILDGTSVLSAPEPVLFAGIVSTVIVVVECERTKWEVAQMTVEKISNAGGSVTGIVLNKRKFYVPKAIYGKI